MGLKVDFSKVNRKLENLAKKAQNKVLDKALEAGSKPILKAMDKNVPIDSSELKGSLGVVKKEGSGTKRRMHLGIDSHDRGIIERGYYQEFGHSRMIGKHWMKKSFNESKSEANEEIKRVLIEELKL